MEWNKGENRNRA